MQSIALSKRNITKSSSFSFSNINRLNTFISSIFYNLIEISLQDNKKVAIEKVVNHIANANCLKTETTYMNFSYLPAKTFVLSLVLMITTAASAYAQQIVINPRSSMVLNGNVSLVINNAAFQNNGTFAAGESTVNFSGHNDTTISYVSGKNSTTFNNLSVSKSANGVALKSAVIVKNVLAVNGGNLYTDSNLTLRSDANRTARVDVVPAGSNIIGKANVERYIPARRAWRLMTAPVTNSNTIYNSWQNKGVYAPGIGLLVTGPNPTGAAGNGLDYSVQNAVSVKGWNYSTQAFTNFTNTKVAMSGTTGSADNNGYFVFIRGDRDPANTNATNNNITTITSIGTLQTGTQTFSASPVVNAYTLIGNPYASPIDFNNVARTNLIKRFYVWDPSMNLVGGYVMMDDLNNDGIYVSAVQGSTQTKYIQSSQAFFVQTNSNGPASITFDETSKSAYDVNGMFRPQTPVPAGIGAGQIITVLNLLETSGKTSLADGVIAEFDNNYSAAIDMDDAVKFTNTNENISIVRNGSSFAAERRPSVTSNDTIYFKLTTTTQRSYQLLFDVTGISTSGLTGYLVDSYLATSTPINLSGITKINFAINAAAASSATNRFKIVFKAISVLPVTISSVKAYQKNSNIQVEWKVENEINMVKYDVEKSTDGANFSFAGTTNVTGANNIYNTYSWLDVNPVQGTNFYRIKSYDKSGEVKYSSIVKVTVGKTNSGFSIYPNPVTGNVINLVMSNQPAGTYEVKLTNVTGQQIFAKSIKTNGGNSTESLNAGSKLTAGIYQLEIIGQDDMHNTQKVIVE